MPINRTEIEALVNLYKQQREVITRSDSNFSEADTRANFIDPFFAALGWDISNKRGLPQSLREVIRETQVGVVDENTKKPDYVFKLGPERRFFVEAKKSSVNILQDSASSFQVRRYGWSAGLVISVLTNFENLVIYDTTIQPDIHDNANKSRSYKFSYNEYVDHLDQIASLISRDTVYSGEFDNHFANQAQMHGGEAIDFVFLQALNNWRLALGRDLLAHNPDLMTCFLNEIIQRFILRVLFLRMCEDRGIQTYEHLKKVAQTNDWSAFISMLQESRRKYDSELFSTENDPFFQPGAQAIRLDSPTVLNIINDLYFPQAPYTFSVFEPEFLGDIYQQFLVERVEVQDGEVSLRRKPENVDRDVVPTPRPIIERLVREIIEPQIANLTLDQLHKFRVVDPACGSGGFLISAFDILTERAISAYEESGISSAFYDTPNGKRLVFDKKIKLLKSCLFGVDRDFLAVEVSRFSLLVKLLEHESSESLPNSVELLPSLEKNIICGDSLVDDRVYNLDPRPVLIGPPLNWGVDITAPFSVVIGNPPYMFTEAMVNLEPIEYEFYRHYYHSAYRQFDKYFLFIERALQNLLADNGIFGMVVSHKFANIESGKKLRSLLSRGRHLLRLIDFGTAQLFQHRTTYTCLLFLSKNSAPIPDNEDDDKFEYELVTTAKDWLPGLVGNYSNRINLPRKLVSGENAWLLPSTPGELNLILALYNETIPLGEIFDVFNGIQTSCNPVFEITDWHDAGNGLIAFTKNDREWVIEENILKPFFDDRHGVLKSFHPMPDTARVIFPYRLETQEDGTLRTRVIPPEVLRRDYQNTYNWLEYNVETLRNRDISPKPYPENEWYRYGRDQALTVFENRPKIVVGVNSVGDKYVYDSSSILLASGGTAGECAIAQFREPSRQTSYDLFFLLAILNHKAIEFFCRKRGSSFRGGWFARGTAVLKDVPIPLILFDETGRRSERYSKYSQVVNASRELCDIYRRLDERLSRRDALSLRRRATSLKRKMDFSISELLHIENIIEKITLPS